MVYTKYSVRKTGKTCCWAGQSAKPIKEEGAVSLVGAKTLPDPNYNKARGKKPNTVAVLVQYRRKLF